MDTFDLRQWEGFSSAGGNPSLPALIDQIVIDSRRIHSSHALFVALKGEKEDGHHYVAHAAQAGAKFALVSLDWQPPSSLFPSAPFSPSLSSSLSLSLPLPPSSSPQEKITLLRVPSPLRAFQAIAKTYRLQLPTKIIGVTGSFGKTMLKDLLHCLLQSEKQVAASPESFNSQIGVPLSLLSLNKSHEIAIIEAGFSLPQEMDTLTDLIRPDYTILTPVGKKHLATLHTLPTLMEEIFKLIKATPDQGWSLLPRDPLLAPHLPSVLSSYFFWNEPHPLLPHASPVPSNPLSSYSIHFPTHSDDLHHPSHQGEITTGYAYMLNLINMAIKAAWLMGISPKQIIEILQEYQPEPTRTEIWKSAKTTFVNDIYCSDPQSIQRSLHYFDDHPPTTHKIFIFGGMRDHPAITEKDYQYIGQTIAKTSLHSLFLVGKKNFKPLIQEIEKEAPHTEVLLFENYEECLPYLSQHYYLQGENAFVFKGERKLCHDRLTQCFQEGVANNQCSINLAAIQTNITLIRRKLPPHTRLMVIIKALAYGTDEIRMAQFLAKQGIDLLGVSYVDEGISLKRAKVQQAIFSIHAALHEITKVVKWELEVGVSDSPFIAALAEEAKKQRKQIKVHLHINTGMGRFGCPPEQALALAQQIRSLPSLELEGLMTHFACADDPNEDPFTWEQVARFDRVIQILKEGGIQVKWTHAANSSGALRFSLPQYNMVRLGLAVYGLYGSSAVHQALDLHLALSLTSRIVSLNTHKKGETISYGRSYEILQEEQKIAVLPIGYFDGLHRHYSGKGDVLVRGQKASMVGKICMDYMMVDVTHIPGVAVGDKVLIFGEDEYGYSLSPEELARQGDSIVHELMTCLGPRIQRVFIYEESKQMR